MNLNVPDAPNKRIVIVGAGFGGLTLAKDLLDTGLQIVLLDKHNYHQFAPLLYQVATSGLEPTAIAFPIRKINNKHDDFFFRMCEVVKINHDKKYVQTSVGLISYDYLVLAAGCSTNYFGIESIASNALPLKSVGQALTIRNHILAKMEQAAREDNIDIQKALMSVVIVGGGPTGVELAGAVAALRNDIFPRDYPQMDFSRMNISLISASSRLLETFDPKLSQRAKDDLVNMRVDVLLDKSVSGYDGSVVTCKGGEKYDSHTMIWASGVIANRIDGIDDEYIGRGRRIKVDKFNRAEFSDSVFVIGDAALMCCEGYPSGHPQVVQVAIQQAKRLARNIILMEQSKTPCEFNYFDKGSMATIGRNRAVVELKGLQFGGFIAWLLWVFIHLLYVVGAHNKITVLTDWCWSYITYDRPLRTIINHND